MTVYNVAVTVQKCVPAPGGTTTTAGGTATSLYTWDSFDRLKQVTVGGTVTEKMWYAAGGERLLHKDANGVHLYLGGMLERHTGDAVLRINGSTRWERR